MEGLMARRLFLLLLAVILLALGAASAWFALSIPNDIQAEKLLRGAREDLKDGKREAARRSLSTLVQQYPRTNAAAAAHAALFELIENDRRKLAGDLDSFEKRLAAERARIGAIEQRLAQPPPAPVVVKPPPATTQIIRKSAPRKTPARRKTPTRRR